MAFGLFRKSEFTFTEKAFIGLGLGLVLLPLIPFFLYFFMGVMYSFNLAVLSTVLLYIIAAAVFVKSGAYQDFKMPSGNSFTISRKMLISLAILLIMAFAFLIRMSTYSPVFQELDPYYYAYVPYQLLTLGENPFDDMTGWYPVVEDNHRIIPALSYLEAVWYSFYTGGAEADNMLLAVITSMYPPLMAALAFFFLYLFISASFRREWAVIGAGIASFAPVLIFKTFAGEQEVQTYAFFALAFFMAMYAFMIKMKDRKFAVLAGLAFMAVSLGSSSQILALAIFLLFVGAQSIVLFIKQEWEDLRDFLINNGIIFALGPLAGTVLKSSFNSYPYFGLALPALAVLAFGTLLYFIPQILKMLMKKEPGRNTTLGAFGAMLIVGLLLFVATPLGDYIKNVGISGFSIASFTSPLSRTIAEQGVTGSLLSDSIGFVAESYPEVLSGLMAIPSAITNFILGTSVGIINALLGTDVVYGEQSSSFLLLWILLFFIALVYALYKFATGKDKSSLVLLFAVVVLPPLLVGIIKAKYTIYSAFMIAAAIAFVLGEGEDAANRYFEKSAKDEKEATELKTQAYYGILVIGALVLLMQFMHNGYAPGLLAGSLQPRFQDNPLALQEKFTQFCTLTNDPDICAASQDPMGYANQGTNYQYNPKLCYYSLVSDIANIGEMEAQVAGTRCHRISDYWIESMEWIRYNTEDDSRTTSWWDYGHWINYFGLKNTVLRNEHTSQMMIGEVAHAYTDGTPEELISFMKSHDSKYALFDMELVMMGGTQLGGKFGALNYLGCSRDNRTSVEYVPGQSACEAEHIWEVIIVPNDPAGRTCTISEHAGKTGVTAYRMALLQDTGQTYVNYYPYYCLNPLAGQNEAFICRNYVIMEPAYCIGEVTLATGEQTYGTYYLDQTYPNGDLKLNKGMLQLPQATGSTYHFGEATIFTMFYTNDMIWLENGEIKSGYEDRKGKFYDSNIYRALFMEEIPGFDYVYSTKSGQVKIFKISG